MGRRYMKFHKCNGCAMKILLCVASLFILLHGNSRAEVTLSVQIVHPPPNFLHFTADQRDFLRSLKCSVSIVVEGEGEFPDDCARGSVVSFVDGNMVASVPVQLGEDTFNFEKPLFAGQRVISTVWVAEGGEYACAQDNVTIWVVPVRLQVVKTPWGALARKRIRVQPWVSIELLVHAGDEEAIWNATLASKPVMEEPDGGNWEVRSRIHKFEVVATLVSEGREAKIGTAVAQAVPGQAGIRLAKFSDLSVPREGLHTVKFHIAPSEVRGWEAGGLEAAMPAEADVFVTEATEDDERHGSNMALSYAELLSLTRGLVTERIRAMEARKREEHEDASVGRRRTRQEMASSHLFRTLLASLPPSQRTASADDGGSGMHESAGVEEAEQEDQRRGGEGGGGGRDAEALGVVPRVAVCLTGAMRSLDPEAIKAHLTRHLPPFELFVFTLDDGTAARAASLRASRLVIEPDVDFPTWALIDGQHYVYWHPYNEAPVQRLLQLWNGVDECFRLVQRRELERERRFDTIIRARPDILIEGFDGIPPLASHTVLVPPTPKVARWAHVTDLFAVGPRDLMAKYMTISRGCLYNTRAPLYDTHPRWDSEEKLEKCLEQLGVPWQHFPAWRFVVRAKDSCGSSGCWEEAEHVAYPQPDHGPYRYFRNGSQAF